MKRAAAQLKWGRPGRLLVTSSRVVAFGVVAVGCGSAGPPSQAPGPAVLAPASVIAAPDMSEVPEPSHLVALVRWKNPQATLDVVYRWTGLRFSGPALASEALDKDLANLLDFEAPVDGAIALDPKGADRDLSPFAAFSVGVRSVDAARRAAQAMGSVTEVRPGEYKVNLRAAKKKGPKGLCLLSVSNGKAPGRFVCGSRERDLEALGAYMTRTLPVRDLGSADLHAELRFSPAVDLYGPMIEQGLRMGAALAPRKLEIGEPTFDRAVSRMALGLSEEIGTLAFDLDSLTLDFAMTPDNATAAGALRFKGQRSWTASTIASTLPSQAPAPPSYWRLPAAATRAGFQYPFDSRRFIAIRRTLAELLDGWLLHEGVAPADRLPVNSLFDEKFALSTPWVYAGGTFDIPVPAAPKATAKAGAPPAPTDLVKAALDGVGWYLVGIATPNAVPEFLKNAAAALSRPKIQAFVKGRLTRLNAGDEPNQDKESIVGVTMKSVAAPKELPKGSTAFEIALARGTSAPAAKKPKAQPIPLKVHILAVAEKGQTWVAFGADRPQLVKTVLSVVEGAPEAGTLAARQDLGALKTNKFEGASFMTLESLQSWSGIAAVLSPEPDTARSAREFRSALSSTPHQGKAPILFTGEVSEKGGLTWMGRAEVPKGVIEDVIILAASVGIKGLGMP